MGAKGSLKRRREPTRQASPCLAVWLYLVNRDLVTSAVRLQFSGAKEMEPCSASLAPPAYFPTSDLSLAQGSCSP